jgi:hypothetical protein
MKAGRVVVVVVHRLLLLGFGDRGEGHTGDDEGEGESGDDLHERRIPRLSSPVQYYFVARLRLPANLVWYKKRSYRHFLF